MTSESSYIVRLDVGGKHFATYRSTLTQYDSPFFASLLAKEQGDGQAHFIDRSPELFALILEALRNPAVPLQPSSEEQSKALAVELNFYGLPLTLLQPLKNKDKKVVNSDCSGQSFFGQVPPSVFTCPPDVNWFAWRDGDYEEQMKRKKKESKYS